jgi:hypothetical protein
MYKLLLNNMPKEAEALAKFYHILLPKPIFRQYLFLMNTCGIFDSGRVCKIIRTLSELYIALAHF